MSLTMRGRAGSVWVGCQRAADLGPWTFASDAGGGLIEATVTRVDQFWGTQPATQIRLMVGRGEWRWRLSGADAGAGTYRVSGPPEER